MAAAKHVKGRYGYVNANNTSIALYNLMNQSLTSFDHGFSCNKTIISTWAISRRTYRHDTLIH